MTDHVPGKRTVQVMIRGRVEGVCFRAWTRVQAERLGITGWVRNRRDGSVEAVFSGSVSAVGEMTACCERGPDLARVESVTIVAEPECASADFKIRQDA